MRDLQYMIDVVTAAKGGKRLQWRDRSDVECEWLNISPNGAVWNWDKYDYRIAPEPRRAREFLFIDGDMRHFVEIDPGTFAAFDSKSFLVREVLPESDK